MFIIARVYPASIEGYDEFVPRILRKQDVKLVERDPKDTKRCYIIAENQPECDADTNELHYLCDHSLEEIANILGCDVGHMEQNFQAKPATRNKNSQGAFTNQGFNVSPNQV
jgi:hypothetical protein